MSRYIDADALVYELTFMPIDLGYREYEDFLKIVNEQPTADVVEVVRCKDCKYYKEYIGNKGSAMMCFCPCCIGGQGKKSEDDYCSYGERREDGTQD